MRCAVRVLLSMLAAVQFLFHTQAADHTSATPPGFPATWGERDGKPVQAYYAFTTNAEVHAALRALPSLYIQMSMDDLFGAERGIYSHPLETGSDWERPASIELKSTEGHVAFKIDCGIRIQGGWNRRPEESPKHAFRVVFKKKYGPGKLRARLFDGAEPQTFDELILRAGCNNTWLHWSGEERKRGDYIRDQWMRDTYRAMGHPSARGEFVHLYLNYYYWGLYNLTERPSASFAAAHFGGRAEDYDARNADNIISGDKEAWDKLFALANAGLKNPDNYKVTTNLLDGVAFADFMLLNYYGANADWDGSSNWYAARQRTPQGRFHFFVWDGERTLEDPNANTLSADDDQSPTRLFHKLAANEGFRKLFATRVDLHLKNALAPETAARRFRELADRLRVPIVAEAARWGAYRHDAHQYKTGPYERYTRDTHWTPEINRILTTYFPNRNEALGAQLKTAGLLE
ncbi:MAG TPA: CotH kinase family protein [Verrucomicrobiae bacterium]|nr:CotH kinase family protein [Verrucomicrobiae bacterium]